MSLPFVGHLKMFVRLMSTRALILAVLSCCFLALLSIYAFNTFGILKRSNSRILTGPDTFRHQKASPHESHLIDLRNFSYLKQLSKCEESTAVLIAIHTAPTNFLRRRNIRETWGKREFLNGTPFRLIFFFGAVDDITLSTSLEEESLLYHDMVQGSFLDVYKNITYKHVMVLKWFQYRCSNAQILIKVDDDIFLNTPLLMRYLSLARSDSTETAATLANVLFRQPKNLIFCVERLKDPVVREHNSKWFMAFSDYSKPYYPPYCPGFFIMYSADVVVRLAKASYEVKFIFTDDVYVTGLLAKRINISITNANAQLLNSDKVDAVLMNNSAAKYGTHFLFTNDGISPRQFKSLWHLSLTDPYKMS